jgi:hypothetical protein
MDVRDRFGGLEVKERGGDADHGPGVVERMWRLSMGTCAGSVTTVVVPPAPRVPELAAAQLKKNRDREYQRRKRAHASRRSVGTVSDDEGSATTAGGRRPIKRDRIAEND